jgi:hypothetical protein
MGDIMLFLQFLKMGQPFGIKDFQGATMKKNLGSAGSVSIRKKLNWMFTADFNRSGA